MRARLARPEELAACLALRHAVFVEEQSVPPDLERDGLDPSCTHFVAFDGDTLVGTARMREKHGSAKAERVAVVRGGRGGGVGRALMAELEAEAARRGLSEVLLNAQLSAVPFYERIGYAAQGEVFEEAGIAHVAMRKAVGGSF